MATYSIGQVAKLSGVSVRTLHHFEALGLIAPKRQANGYREYSSTDLERLQQVLLYRACGMPLGEIAGVLDAPGADARGMLERHLAALSAQRQQLETLIGTVEKTIASLEGKTTMTDAERFEGLKQAAIAENEKKYGAEARARYGDAAVDAANKKLAGMSQQEWNTREELECAIIEQLKAAMADGDARGEAARQLAEMHAQWIRMSWGDGAYSREAHLGLAHGYLADDRFRDYYDSRAGEGATEFLVEAIEGVLG